MRASYGRDRRLAHYPGTQARPYPAFPQASDIWGDTLNWRTGHWLNGRVGSGEARNLITAIAAQAGVTPDQLDLDEVSGTIDGYVIEQPMTAADALSPALAYLGLAAAERGGRIGFVASDHGCDATLLRADLVCDERNPLMARRDLIDVPASLTLRGYDLDRDYQLLAVTVRRDDVAGASRVDLDLPLCLSHARAADYAAYVLQSRQGVRHSLSLDIDPLNLLALEVGDTLQVEGEAGLYRVIAIDQDETPSLTLEPAPGARRPLAADPSLSGGVSTGLSPSLITGFTLLELPCFGVDDGDVRPILVPTADPWQGVDVYAGASAETLRLRGRVERRPSVGKSLMALPAQRGNVLLPEAWLDIHLEGDAPVSRSEEALLGGENFICIKALNGEWEIVQYLTVAALAADRYRLHGLVRGQWGSEQALTAGIGEDADVVLLPSGFVRAEMAGDERGLDRLWRCGRRGFGGAVDGALDAQATWSGPALRPRAPVHGAVVAVGADLTLSWVRRARYGGDSWESEPPLCEDYELYRVEIYDGATLKRSVELASCAFVYAAADITADFPSGFDGDSHAVIAQKSQVYGHGPGLRVGLLLS